ncbi:hypothetical protein [Vibrio sp. 10N.261.55.A7]|uniref:hypothetical protein n=1 Tax=Vibrio sp. 10N.261.55.A7 TaxID=1880851 RepID=UPI000C829FB0|nr:hypothetical protein [Vibrio sp. 10N.261.55.A7]PMJ90297.1 hypothetical protein BCU12_12455 [Vibrio sp. 10N.261.55.A7]
MASTEQTPVSKLKLYPLLKPLRQNGRWWFPDKDQTISLLPSQATMLLLSGKIGKPVSPKVVTESVKLTVKTTPEKEGK